MGYEPGGIADKLGNRYEGRWVAKQLLRLLREEIASVTVEAIGDDEHGVDLWVGHNGGIRQAQQCKARNKSKESWTIRDLALRGVLARLRSRLDADPQNEFAFVSAVGGTLFQDICDSARLSDDDPEDFFKHQIEALSKERRDGFRGFCSSIGLKPGESEDRKQAFGYLRRTFMILQPDDRNAWQDLLTQTSYELTGAPPETIVSVLTSYAENNDAFRKPIYADALRKHLAALGIHPRALSYDQRIGPAIEELQIQFRESIEQKLIRGTLIPRPETGIVLAALMNNKDVILHGSAGYGKSVVLYGLVQALNERGISNLAVRLDRREPKGTAPQFGIDLGLPDSPALSLAGYAKGRPCVLILDQLDAIRWTSTHSGNALEVCKELVRQVQSLRADGKDITLAMSCRSFDLENDPEIRAFVAGLRDSELTKVAVSALDMATLAQVIGPSFHQMSERQKRILMCPQNLALWFEISASGAVPEFRSATELMRRFWESKRVTMEREGIPAEQITVVLDRLVDFMERNGKISGPRSLVSSWPNTTKALFSNGIVQEADGQIMFAHQTYLDHLIALRVLREINRGSGNIIDWLGPRTRQSLFRREQLRQALSMISEETPYAFVDSVAKLLSSAEVRFHLKHLILEFLGQFEEVGKDIGRLCLDLVGDSYWENHVLETVFVGHPPYVSFLIERGIIASWLASESDESINRALWLLRSVNDKIGNKITHEVRPFLNRSEAWSSWLLNTICWQIADDSEDMFELRLELAHRGIMADFVDWKSLCSKHPLRAIRLIEAAVSTWDVQKDGAKRTRSSRSRMENWSEDDITAMRRAARANAAATWDLLFPHVERLTGFVSDDGYDQRLDKWQEDRFLRLRSKSTQISRGIVELVMAAGEELAKQDPQALVSRCKAAENSVSIIVQEILATIYAHLVPEYADVGVAWLIADQRRLALGSGYNEPKWMPAVRLVTSLSPHCGDELFRELEGTIVRYHSPSERKEARHYLKGWQTGYFGYYWGAAQYFLLPVLSPSRVKSSTAELMALLNRRYASFPKERFLASGIGSGGWIGSKLDRSLDRISDRAWLNIITNKARIPKNHNEWVQIDENHAVTATIEQFSRSLGSIAKRFPERFGRLSLIFPQDVHPLYVSAILDALAQESPGAEIPPEEKDGWLPASSETVKEVLDKHQAGDDRDTAISFCRLIEQRAKENWPEAVIGRLVRYAMDHEDLQPGKLNVYCDKTDEEATVDILFQNTINCVRGVAAEAIGQLLWNHNDWLSKLRIGIESLVNDVHSVVRMASIRALLPILNIDRDLAVSWFCDACEKDLRVAASPLATEFFNYTIESHFGQVSSLVRAMLTSTLDEVSEQGAKEVAARWLLHGFFEKDIAAIRNGAVSQRKGVAEIASQFLDEAKYSTKCEDLLVPLLDDPEREVRDKARVACFLGDAVKPEFVEYYIRSKAFKDHPDTIVYCLKDYPCSLIPLAPTVFMICDMLSNRLLEDSREPGSGAIIAASEVSTILFRLYEQCQGLNNGQIANRCMDIWDAFFEKRVGVVRELTKAIER